MYYRVVRLLHSRQQWNFYILIFLKNMFDFNRFRLKILCIVNWNLPPFLRPRQEDYKAQISFLRQVCFLNFIHFQFKTNNWVNSIFCSLEHLVTLFILKKCSKSILENSFRISFTCKLSQNIAVAVKSEIAFYWAVVVLLELL